MISMLSWRKNERYVYNSLLMWENGLARDEDRMGDNCSNLKIVKRWSCYMKMSRLLVTTFKIIWNCLDLFIYSCETRTELKWNYEGRKASKCFHIHALLSLINHCRRRWSASWELCVGKYKDNASKGLRHLHRILSFSLASALGSVQELREAEEPAHESC